jgi:hypothetical protein
MATEKRAGPLVVISRNCTGCTHLESEYFCVEDGNDVDSGHSHYCGHFRPRQYINSYSDRTPDWCPFLASPDPVKP